MTCSPATPPSATRNESAVLTRARRYLNNIPPAVAGCGGDTATYRAAAAMVKGFSLAPETALPLLQEWNASCVPPWSDRELRTKLTSAARSRKPSGYLLVNDKYETRAGARNAVAEQTSRRRHWPVFHELSDDDCAALAALRGVSLRAVLTVRRCGHLWRCRWQQEECVAIRHNKFAQVRRMDGQVFTARDGSRLKALNLPGSEGSFLNPGGMGAPDLPVLITEGAISILEAVEMVLRASADAYRYAEFVIPRQPLRTGPRLRPFVIFTAVAAGSRFTEQQLAALAGRCVYLVPDTDIAGHTAAAAWASALRHAGCTVRCAALPDGCKDAGDALRRIPPEDDYWQQLLAVPSPVISNQ